MQRTPIPAASALLVAALAVPTSAQETLLDLAPIAPPSAALESFGYGVDAVGDLDADGYEDLVIGVRKGLFGLVGHVQVTSGRTRAPLATLFPDVTSTTDLAVAGVGDLDLDGFPDVAVGAPRDDGAGADAGRVLVYDGQTLALALTLEGDAGDELGFAVDGAGDADLDGSGDLLVGVPGFDAFGFVVDSGRADIRSGVDGSVLFSYAGLGSGNRMGEAVALLGFVHFDVTGMPDFAIGAPGGSYVQVYDSPTALLRTHGGAAGARFGAAITGVPALLAGGDTFGEYAIGAPEADLVGPFGSSIDAGRVAVYAGDDGGLVWDDHGVTGERRGLDLASSLDLGAGFSSELLVGGALGGYVYAAEDGAEVLSVPATGRVFVGALDHTSDAPVEREGVFGMPFADNPDLDAGEVQVRVPGLAPEGTLRARIKSRSHGSLGAAVALLDDLDGDGRGDLAVGIPFDDRGGPEAGAVEVRSGADGSALYTILGAPGEQLGAAVCRVGDLDADGRADLAVGAPRSTVLLGQPFGRVAVHSAATGAPLLSAYGASEGGRFGAALADAGDFDGDGTPDVAAGEPWSPGVAVIGDPDPRVGRAVVLSGAGGALLGSWLGASAHGRFGAALAGLGDASGDGRGDVAASEPGFAGAPGVHGRVAAYSALSTPPLWEVTGDQEGAELGAALAALGDVDGDGTSELAIGAPGWDHPSGAGDDGRVDVVSGADGGAVLALETSAGDRFGAAVAAAGDVDYDGAADVAVGEPGFVSPITLQDVGRVRVLAGVGGADLRAFPGVTPAQPLGTALAGGGDVDGDGAPDLLAGAPGADDTAAAELADTGAARALSSRALGTAPYGTGTPGCAGAQVLELAAAAEVGGTAQVRCSGYGPGAFGALVLSTAPDLAGSDAFGVGALVHVDLLGLFLFQGLPTTSGSHLAVDLPVPPDPLLAGFAFYAQVGSVWVPGCPELPGGFSSSSGLEVTIQP